MVPAFCIFTNLKVQWKNCNKKSWIAKIIHHNSGVALSYTSDNFLFFRSFVQSLWTQRLVLIFIIVLTIKTYINLVLSLWSRMFSSRHGQSDCKYNKTCMKYIRLHSPTIPWYINERFLGYMLEDWITCLPENSEAWNWLYIHLYDVMLRKNYNAKRDNSLIKNAEFR